MITPGVYAVHPLPIDWLARAWTGVLIGGETALVGGWAAAHLHGFANEPRLIQIWVGKTPPRPRPQIYFRRDGHGRTATQDGIPRTGVVDTVLDLCQRSTADGVASLIAEACNKTAVTPDELAEAVGRRVTLGQRELIRECLEAVTGGADSALERRYLLDVEQAHGLPTAHRQSWTDQATRVDALLAEYGVVVELDGRKGHIGTGAFRDLRRDNEHQTRGLITLRYGWDDLVFRPCEVARQIAMVLMQRGWPGPMTRCAHCLEAPLAIAG
ncbi:hypothetical protein CGZ95_07720 [Enemella evansiae]|nr:hypothetical protein CGZ95_07720 [Enemella evansiae]OYO16987.1 hypothetical protein BI335_09550 [Enemella evansiae]